MGLEVSNNEDGLIPSEESVVSACPALPRLLSGERWARAELSASSPSALGLSQQGHDCRGDEGQGAFSPAPTAFWGL